jgi:NDP-sugar pyrophosphorylase family protein
VGAFYYEHAVPYGVLALAGEHLAGIDEKPTLRWPCNAGFYCLDPSVLDLIPTGEPFTGPELFEAAMAQGRRVVVFPIAETLIDIGNWEDLNKALIWFLTGEEDI